MNVHVIFVNIKLLHQKRFHISMYSNPTDNRLQQVLEKKNSIKRYLHL